MSYSGARGSSVCDQEGSARCATLSMWQSAQLGLQRHQDARAEIERGSHGGETLRRGFCFFRGEQGSFMNERRQATGVLGSPRRARRCEGAKTAARPEGLWVWRLTEPPCNFFAVDRADRVASAVLSGNPPPPDARRAAHAAAMDDTGQHLSATNFSRKNRGEFGKSC